MSKLVTILIKSNLVSNGSCLIFSVNRIRMKVTLIGFFRTILTVCGRCVTPTPTSTSSASASFHPPLSTAWPKGTKTTSTIDAQLRYRIVQWSNQTLPRTRDDDIQYLLSICTLSIDTPYDTFQVSSSTIKFSIASNGTVWCLMSIYWLIIDNWLLIIIDCLGFELCRSGRVAFLVAF